MTVQKIAITSREQWLSLRSQDVTASVAACLLGGDEDEDGHPFITPYKLWNLKSGIVAEDPEETSAMRRGRLLEPAAVQMIREDCPDWELEPYPHGYYYRDPEAHLGATPDLTARCRSNGRRGVIQIKNVEPSVFRRKWCDDDGDLRPPLWPVVQGIIEAHLVEAEWAAVAVMTVGFGANLHIVPVPIHAGIVDCVRAETVAFWRSIRAGIPPDPDPRRDGNLVERLYRGDGETIDLTGDNAVVALLDEKAQLAKTAAEAKARLKEIKCELLLKLRGAPAARLGDGRLLTAKRVECKAHAVAASSYVKIGIKEARS